MNCKLPQITRETIDVVKNLGERFAIDYYRKNNLSNFASFKDMMNNNSILFSEAKLLEVVEKFLPKNSFQVKHLNNIIQNLPADSQAAFFKDVLYFGDNVTKEQIAEETFHAIFQRVIPNSLRDKYLEEGRSLIENIEKSKKDYLENYPKASLLNEKQLEERVIEEAIAKKYVEYFNNNISPSNKKGILKLLDNFFKWLKDLFNNLRNGDNLEILFNNILKGKFTKSTIQNTNESEVPTLRLITYMGKDMNGSDEQKNLTVKESEFLISALGSIVIGLNNLKVETLQKLNLTNRARRIQFAIEKLREVYAKEGKNNNPKFVSALSQHTTKVLNKEATSIKDRIIKTELPNLKNLAEDVNNYLNIVTGVEIKNAEIDEDEVAEVNYGDMIAANERGFEGMSAWLRSYIATTGSFEDSFEVEGESVDVLRPIDKNKVYYSLARSMQNTTHELERLYKLVTIGSFNTNTETRLLIDRVIKDVMNYNLSDENERFKKFKEDVTSLYNTWKSNKKKHHYIINTLPNFNKEKSYILQTILQGFDLWKRDNYKVELEFKSGTYHTKVYEANQNSASKVQLEMWQNKWEETIANPQEKARVRKILESYARKIDSLIDNKTITKANLDDILNTIFYDVDDSYLTYLLDSDTNNSLGGTFTGTATLEDVKKIFEIALKETDTNNKESNLFLSGDKGARARIEKFAVNVSKINEKVIESTYKDAENKTRYSYQNKTFQLYMFNEIFNMNNIDYYLGNIMEKQMYEYAEGKFLEQASTFLYKGENNSLNHIIFSDDLWKKSFVNGDFYSVDGLDGGVGSSTFGGMTNRDFLLWKLHLKAFKTKGVNKDNSGNFEYFTQPIHINLMEAKRTASFKEVRVIEGLFKDGEITDLAIDLFGKEIKKEVYRMYEEKSKILNWLKILAKDLEDGEHVIKLERKNVIAKGKVSDSEGIIEKYHTGEYKIEKKENDIKIISGGGRALQFTDNVKNLLSKETYNSIISNVFITESIDKNTVIPTISRELKSQLNEYIKEYESVIKELRGVLPSSSDTRYKNLNEIVNGKNFNRDGFLNDELSSWLNTTWVNQLINSDSALLVKNDGADFVKRAGGQNAAIASLSTTFYSDKLKGINKFDKIKYVVGNDPQGIISFKTDEKVDSADAQSYMTVDAYLKYLHSTSKLTSESSEILFKIKDGIPLTEKDRKYLKENDIFFNVIKPVGYDGYFYFKTGTVMLTKNMTSILVIKDGKEVWIAKPGREALHNLREKMEATGVDYYLGQTASKQLTINKYTEDFDNIRFNGKEEIDEIWNGSTNVMSTKFFGQQMENPAGKEKIIDPSQMLEIILNEQELNGATFDIMLNGQKFPIGEILKKWQALSINRVSLTFQEAMNEIADDNLIIQSDKFIKKVQDVLASSGADDQLLEIFSLDKDGKPLYNLNMSVSVDKFINLLMSHFSKGVLQQKVAGDAMALISPHGMNVIKKIIKHETIDGKIVYSWKVIRESDSEYNKALNSKLHRLENIAEYDEFDNKSQLKGGSSELINTLASLYDENKDVYFVDQLRFGKPVYTFNEDGLVEGVEYYGAEAILPKHKEGINVDELNKMFGLRIPSQDKQSAVNLIWVDELASYYGNTISVPKEIQYLSGSDYDIDKLYIHRKETFEKDGKEIVWGIEHNTFEMYKYYHTTGNSLVRKRIKELIKEDEYLPKLKIKLNSILKELEDFKEDPELYTLSFYTKDIVEKINNSDEEEQEKYYEELEKIQNQFDNLDANLKSAKILELKALIKASKDSVKDGINYVKDVLTGIAFKEFKLITKEKEFNERKEKEGILILPIINNEMLELKLRLLTNDATLDRSKGEAVSLTPATQDNLKKFIAKTYIIENGKPFYLFKTNKGDDEFTTEIKHATHSTLGQHIAHKNVVTGKRNIGVAVVANLLHLFSKKANIVVYKDVLIEDVTPSLSKNDGLHELVEHRLSKFNISRNVKDQRIADIISELISAATDEVKDQQNAKYGLTMEALNIVTPILMLGGSLDFAIRLINTSSVREYLNKVSMKDNIVKTEDEKSELQASNETILNNLLGGYIPSEKPLSIVDLKKGVANKEALAFASKMLAISREIGMVNYVIGLKKGLKKTIEEFEDGESKIESTTKEKPNPLQMTNMSLVFKQENENLEIYQEQIKLHKILSEFFNNNIVSRKNQFQILKYHFINNFKPATYDEARKWVNDNMVSFIYSRLYFNYLDKRLNLNDDKFEEYTKAKLEDVEKEWTDFVNKIKSKDSSLGISNELIEDISKNPLITKLKKNTKGRIYAPTFIKSDIATNVSLLESFYDLHMKLINTDESLGYNNLMWKLFHYSVHKDGWTFKGGSLSKVIPPVFFTSHSKSLDEFVKNPSTYNGEYSNGYLAYIAIERAMQTKDGTSYIKEANRKDDDLWGRLFKNETISLETIENLKQQDQTWLLDRGYIVADVKGNIFPQFPLYHKFRIPKTDGSGKLESVIHRMEKLNVLFDDKITREITPEQYFDNINRVEKVLEIKYKIWSNPIKKENIDENMINLPIRKGIKIEKLDIGEKVEEKEKIINTEFIIPSEVKLYSGAAKGSDKYWVEIGKKYNVEKIVEYIPNTLKFLTKPQQEEVEGAYLRAVKDLGRKVLKYDWSNPDAVDENGKSLYYSGGLVRRDYLQAKAGDAIFAISSFENGNYKQMKVKGGTAYAVQMGLNLGKSVYLFDQELNKWFLLDLNLSSEPIELGETPILTKNFTGVGTREINENGKKAIRDIYEKTFNREINQPTAKQQSVNTNIKSIKELQNNPDFKPLNITGRSGGAVKDTAKMKLGNKLISFGEEGSSTWYYQQDAGVNHNPQTYSSNDIINISVNGNSRANQKENVEKTKQEILKAIQQGVNYFVADEMNYAKQGFNSNGEGEIARWFMEDVNGKIANVEYKSALNNQAGIYKVVLLQQPVNTNLTAEQPYTKKDFVRTKGYFILTNYEQGYDGSFLNYKVYNSNNEKLFYVYKDDSRIDIPDIIFREFNRKGINISKDDVEDMIKNVDKNNEIYKELKQSEKQTDENQPDITKQQQEMPLNVVQDNVLFDSSLPKVNIYAGTGENADLSNFAIRPFKFQVQPNNNAGYAGEKTFQSVEQAFQWHKVQYADTIGMGARNRNEIAQDILNTTDGRKLRKLGKDFYLIKFKSRWDNASSYIMKELLKASFEQNPDALAKLLATGNAELTHKYNNAEQDKGRFSKLLMEVRQELTQQQQKTLLNVSEKIYSQLGNKTQSENVVIKPWGELKNVVKAITPQNIISTRIKNSNEHFGNPFSHNPAGKTQGLIKTETVKEAVERYIDLVINSQDNFYTGKITPSKDTIFVFGSNPEGRHGLGAAKIAKEQFGAIYGQGEGLQGNAYALPTKDLRVKDNNSLKSIDENTIINSIKKLYEVAKQNPTKQFKIAYTNTTEKSLNGYTGLEMINMFNQAGIAPNNIVFSEEWHNTGKLLNSRAEWIREQLKSGKLKDKPIVYYKELGEPSHATALDYLINKYDWNQIPIDIEQQKKTEPQIDSLPWENKDSLTDIKQKSKDEPYLIFSKDGVDYYMNDQQKAAFDFLVKNIKKRMENNPPVYTSSFEDRMIFESPLTKSFSNIIPKELYNNMFGLQGFGGTGKTTISKKLLAALSNSDNVFSGKTVEFVAPTHIASTQLQEALEVDSEGIEKVSTIAKYLRLEPKGNQITEEGFVPRTEEDYIKTYRYMTPVGSPDIIVIDESSMLGTDNMKLFIQRMITDYNQGVMREFPIMLFLGDYHQLPPIESSKDNQNKLGIISSLILKNKQKSPVLTQVMRSDDKELADLYLSVANQIDKYLDSVEKGENYEMSASDFKDFLKRDNTNILSVTGNTPKSIEALIDEYVDYLVKNDYPDGMFWLHYNRLGNSDTQEMLRKIRLKYLQKFDKNLKILPDNYIKNDYVTADVGLPFYTPLLKIPDNIIPKDSLFYKLNKFDNLKNGIRIISAGIIKPKSRYKIIEQIVNRPISLEELQEAFNGEEGSFFYDKNIKRVFKDAKVDIDLLYNRQKRIRGLFSFTNIVLVKQEVYYSDVRKDGSRSKLGLEYFFYNTDTKETGSFKVLFNDKEKFQTILATIKDENNKDKRNKGTKIFSPSYIGSSHSYQGAGINNVVGDSTNVLKYLGKGGIHQLDIMASLYTIITRTKNRLIVIGNESGYNAKNWSGLKMDEQPSAEKDKLPNDTSPFDDTNFMDLTNDNPPSCV